MDESRVKHSLPNPIHEIGDGDSIANPSAFQQISI